MRDAPVSIERAATGPLVFRPLDPARDAALLHDWVNRPHARFWNQQGKTLAEVESIYRSLQARGEDLRLACRADNGEPMLLLWLYDPRQDALGQHYPVQRGDRGFHLFLAPAERTTPGLTFQLITAAVEALFADGWVERVVCEPDLRNEKMITRLLQAGFRRERVLHLSNKNALLMSFSHERLRQGWPALPPQRPALGAWALRVRWHVEKGRLVRAWRALRGTQH